MRMYIKEELRFLIPFYLSTLLAISITVSLASSETRLGYFLEVIVTNSSNKSSLNIHRSFGLF